MCVFYWDMGGPVFLLGFKSDSVIGSRAKKTAYALSIYIYLLIYSVCVCGSRSVCVCVLILIFRRGLLSIPTCVNTGADQMADNDFQIDTLHSPSRENQWALIAFFPRRSSSPEGYYLSLPVFCLLFSNPHSRHHSVSLRLNQFMLLFMEDLRRKDGAGYLFIESIASVSPSVSFFLCLSSLSNTFLLRTKASVIAIHLFFSLFFN